MSSSKEGISTLLPQEMYLGSKYKAWWLWVWVGSLKGCGGTGGTVSGLRENTARETRESCSSHALVGYGGFHKLPHLRRCSNTLQLSDPIVRFILCWGFDVSAIAELWSGRVHCLLPGRLVSIFTALVSQASLTPCSPPRPLCIAYVAGFLRVLLLQEFPVYLLAFDNFAQYKPPVWSVLTPWCNCNSSSSVPPLGFGIIFSQLKTWEGGPGSPRPQAVARQVAVPHAVTDAQESGNGSHWKGPWELI